jgi:cardiolipin synthase
MPPWVEILGIVWLTAQILGILSAFHALMSVRSAQGTIGWIISLLLLPVVAVPLYLVFGRPKYRGYVLARQNRDSRFRELVDELNVKVRPFLVELDADRGRIRAAERLAKLPFVGNNRIELLIDGQATFDSIFSGIEQAQDYVLIQFFIVKDDELGQELKTRLLAAAERGVRVYFLYDEIGSHQLPGAYTRELRSGGVRIQPFQTTRGSGNRLQLNFRNHRKIVVADGREGWIGGHNVGDEYLGRSKKFGHWRDTHARLVGPAVGGLQLSFVEDWNWATDEPLELSWEFVPAPDGNVPVLILPSGPADELETASLMFQHAIHSATSRIWIASPYFVLDEGINAALHLAKLRGVDVRILIPDAIDHLIVWLAAFAFCGELLDAGIEIYRYEDGFLHEKVFLVDDNVAAVGTVNLDPRSYRMHFEITAIAADRDFAAEVEKMLVADFSAARRMTRAELDAKPLWFRAAARAAYLSSPLQ